MDRCASIRCVCITIDLDDDVLLAARCLARRDGTSIGSVVSELARRALNSDLCDTTEEAKDSFYGFHPLPKRGRPVTNDMIERLREDGPY